jgi:hypothetical protein
MTFATTCIGLFPIMWATGAGSDVMKRIAAPMVGGIFTSFLLEMLVYPAIYEVWKRNSLFGWLAASEEYPRHSAQSLALLPPSGVLNQSGD